MASKVKASDLEYDGKTSVINYINRLEYMASTYRDSAILPLLPSAIKGAARTWFNSIFLSVRMDINQSLVLWCEKLTARFRKDPLITCAKADNMLYRFNSENSDVWEYMTRKMELY
jgi:hypothetical protein